MSQDHNIEQQKKFGAAAQSGAFEQFAELVAPDCIDHDPAPGQVAGPQGYATFFREMRAAFPDMKIEPIHLVADADNVAFAYTLTGTHQGTFMNVPPTGRPIKVRGLQISKFKDGKMVERWGSSDELGILKQLGAA